MASIALDAASTAALMPFLMPWARPSMMLRPDERSHEPALENRLCMRPGRLCNVPVIPCRNWLPALRAPAPICPPHACTLLIAPVSHCQIRPGSDWSHWPSPVRNRLPASPACAIIWLPHACTFWMV